MGYSANDRHLDDARRAEYHAAQALERIMIEHGQFLAAIDFPGAQLIKMRAIKAVPKRFGRSDLVYRRLPPILAWRCVSQFPRTSTSEPSEEWLGQDGKVYQKMTSWIQGQSYDDWRIAEPSIGSCYRNSLQFISRMLRHCRAPGAPTASMAAFASDSFGADGVTVELLTPRPALPTQGQQTAAGLEAQCEDPRAAIDQQAIPQPRQLRSRQDYIRYLLMSCLHQFTLAGPGTASSISNIDSFLTPFAPYVPGGQARVGEVVDLIAELAASGQAEWIDVLRPERRWGVDVLPAGSDRFSGVMPEHFWTDAAFGIRYDLILTEDGLCAAEDNAAAFTTAGYVKSLRKELLLWVGRKASSTSVSLPAFCANAASHIDGVPATRADVVRTARWLTSRGYISAVDSTGYLTDSAQVRITRQGLTCIDHYGGDPDKMGEAQQQGGSHHSFQASDGGIINISTRVSNQVGKLTIEHVDIASLVRFTEAVTEALPSLSIPTPEKSNVSVTAAEILKEAAKADPDHPRLKALGAALRSTVQDVAKGAGSSAGSSLAAALLSLWHP